LPIYQAIKPYLFTTHMLGWKGFFDVAVDANNQQIPGSVENLPAVLKSAGMLLMHVVLFLGASVVVFRRKDILS
jgi:ABC-2 type transport system permease protein